MVFDVNFGESVAGPEREMDVLVSVVQDQAKTSPGPQDLKKGGVQNMRPPMSLVLHMAGVFGEHREEHRIAC